MFDAIYQEGLRQGYVTGARGGAANGLQAAREQVNLELRAVLVKGALVERAAG